MARRIDERASRFCREQNERAARSLFDEPASQSSYGLSLIHILLNIAPSGADATISSTVFPSNSVLGAKEFKLFTYVCKCLP